MKWKWYLERKNVKMMKETKINQDGDDDEGEYGVSEEKILDVAEVRDIGILYTTT